VVDTKFLEVLVLEVNPLKRDAALEELVPANGVLTDDQMVKNGWEFISCEGGRGEPGIEAFDQDIDEGFTHLDRFACITQSFVKLGSSWVALGAFTP
jgi:hypothetical protein